MLTEDDLRELIDSAGADAPAPSSLPDDLFRGARARPHRGRQLALTAAVLVGVGAVAAVVPGDQLPFLRPSQFPRWHR